MSPCRARWISSSFARSRRWGRGLAARLAQVADHPFTLNQGTLYPTLVRLEQKGRIRAACQKTEHNRDAKYYRITRAATRALDTETARWRRLVHLVDELLVNEG